jgi:hypothetical protein
MLIVVESPHYVAGIVLDGKGRVERCAPIVRKWAQGKDTQQILAYCVAHGLIWTCLE